MIQGKILKQLFLSNAIPFSMLSPFFMRTKVLDKYVHGLSLNLAQISPTYLSGLTDGDLDFLKSTTSKYLFNRLQEQFKANGIQADKNNEQNPQPSEKKLPEINIDFNKLELSSANFEIRPYVVFGKTLQERFESHPKSEVIKLTRNRFFARMGSKGLMEYLRSISRNQVYGFICTMYLRQGEQSLKIVSLAYQGTIQTEQFYVVDIQNLLFNEDSQHPAQQ